VNTTRAAGAFLAAALVGSMATGSAGPPPDPAPPARRALLVGIDRYLSDGLDTLKGCVNDVESLRGVLVGRFEVPPENIRVLTNEDATRDAILAAIRDHLIAPAGPGDVVILHFSGHGSQRLDDSSDEPDGWDETIVPHDSRVGTVYDITDDELNALLAQLSARTPNVTVILDSCHSGSGVRAVKLGGAVRQAPRDTRPPVRRGAAAGRGLLEGPDDVRPLGANYVLISGALPNELSNEGVFGDRSHGALSYGLVHALENLPPLATYRDLMDRVQAEVTARFPSQHPQLEGAGMDAVVFGVERLSQRPFVLAEPLDGSRVKVAAGEVHGLGPGTSLRVYAPGTKSFADAPVAARVAVTSAGAFSSEAAIQGAGSVAPHSRAVLDAVRPLGFTAGLILEGDAASPLLQAVRQQLADYDFVRVVTSPADAHLRLRVAGQEAVLANREGEPLGSVPIATADAAGEIVGRVLHWAKWNGTLAIDNPNPSLEVDLRLERVGSAGGVEPAPEEVPEGTRVRITAANRSSQPLYMVLLDLTSEGAVEPLRPRKGQPPEQVAPGRAISVDPTAGLKSGRQRTLDVVKLIATTKPVPSDVFTQEAAKRSADVGLAGEDPLTAYLRRAVRGRARDLQLEPVVADAWVTRQRSLRVSRPAARAESFAVHFGSPAGARGAGDALRLAGARSVCSGPDHATCYEVTASSIDASIAEVRRPTRRDATLPAPSVGQAFEEAYRLRKETGALRAEPLFEVDVPSTARPPEARGSLFDRAAADSRAEAEPLWSLEQVRAPEAWSALQANPGRPAGAEARGVFIAHPDTGYRPHPEIWDADPSKRPVWAEAGYDYVADDRDATDDLVDDQLLDNPGHGTGSGSAIVSPEGCQLPGALKCPTGIARGARLIPLRVHRSVVHFDTRQLSQAIADASSDDRSRVGAPSGLMSISMGGVPSWTLWRAVTNAEKRGYLIVAAAGNYVHTVVWPARFDSTIAVAATNVGCRPWAYTSAGPAVDVSAPGESVWRASLEGSGFATGMGSGTTYATATVAGVAALWMSRHAGTPAFAALREEGRVTEVFRQLLQQTAWKPGAVPSQAPPGVACDADASWNSGLLGAGIVDAAALIARPLPTGAPRGPAPAAAGLADLPLFVSLYPEGASLDAPRADYRRLFGPGVTLEAAAVFEAEVMHHYAMSREVAGAIDAAIAGVERSDAAFLRAREALRGQDLSDSLRAALAP
jgi:hypothetical protein